MTSSLQFATFQNGYIGIDVDDCDLESIVADSMVEKWYVVPVERGVKGGYLVKIILKKILVSSTTNATLPYITTSQPH